MQIGSIHEVETLTGIPLAKQLKEELADRHSATFCLPDAAGKLIAIGREISLALDAVGSVLVIEHTGIWPNSENKHLVEIFRMAFGEIRPLRDAPAHAFAVGEHANCWTLLSICFFNGWDFVLVSADQRITARGSHDGYLDVCGAGSDDLERIRAVMQRLEVEEGEPAVRRVVATREQEHLAIAVQSASELRELSRTSPADASVRQRLAAALCELAGFQEIESGAVLEELRLLMVTNPRDAVVRAHYAGALDARLYYASEERNADRVDSLVGAIRQLAHTFPEDANLREIFARALARALSSLRNENGHLKHSLIKELQQLAASFPHDADLQQWLESAK